MAVYGKCSICGKYVPLPDNKTCDKCKNLVNDLAIKALRKAGYGKTSSDGRKWEK